MDKSGDAHKNNGSSSKKQLLGVLAFFVANQYLPLSNRAFGAKSLPIGDKYLKEPLKHSEPKNLWIDEAITHLGLDRIGLKRPDKAIHRLIKKGALHPKKISGRLVFSREELDRVLTNGDHKKGRGRPRKR